MVLWFYGCGELVPQPPLILHWVRGPEFWKNIFIREKMSSKFARPGPGAGSARAPRQDRGAIKFILKRLQGRHNNCLKLQKRIVTLIFSLQGALWYIFFHVYASHGQKLYLGLILRCTIRSAVFFTVIHSQPPILWENYPRILNLESPSKKSSISHQFWPDFFTFEPRSWKNWVIMALDKLGLIVREVLWVTPEGAPCWHFGKSCQWPHFLNGEIGKNSTRAALNIHFHYFLSAEIKSATKQ